MKYAVLLIGLVLLFAVGCPGEPEQKPTEAPAPQQPVSPPVATPTEPETTPEPEPAPPMLAPAEQPTQTQFIAQGSDLEIWTAPRTNTIAPHAGGMLITSAEDSPNSGGRTQGVHVQVPDALELAASGNRVKVTVVAKKAEENGANEFAVAYSTAEVGNSGWRRFEPTADFETFTFEYNVNPMREGRGDFVGIWADTSAQGAGIVVQSLTVEVIVRQ